MKLKLAALIILCLPGFLNGCGLKEESAVKSRSSLLGKKPTSEIDLTKGIKSVDLTVIPLSASTEKLIATYSPPVNDFSLEAESPLKPAEEIVADPVATWPRSSRDVQRALKNAELYHGAIDGKIGPQTTKAIKTFQEQHNLKIDGKVGPQTWERLYPFLKR